MIKDHSKVIKLLAIYVNSHSAVTKLIKNKNEDDNNG